MSKYEINVVTITYRNSEYATVVLHGILNKYPHNVLNIYFLINSLLPNIQDWEIQNKPEQLLTGLSLILVIVVYSPFSCHNGSYGFYPYP